ncbi:hypothetical protein [Chamaesiphon sp. VAR_48_metabat_403]|uniref:hypothetical protein n=1 Tax=Chamaesiphon sp. VAR_48_metabat_403 TaxID=2964700 RepID=UPI00286E029D|nr:hypothetical protein [Chamaesiphon sp. VAR_48_metabat_403]
MLERYLDRISNLNPQLVRELKCRVSKSNLVIVTAISVFAQSLPFILVDRTIQQNTPLWWLNICEILSREIWFSLAFGGIYLIATDFSREIRSGTLDIVNLAPIKPIEVLLGKLLGVPILIYWGVFLALPLHIISVERMAAIAPNGWVGDLVSVSEIGLLYLYALLSTIRFPLPPIVMSIALTITGWFALVTIDNSLVTRHLSGSYSNLGIYLTEEWWVIWKASVTFLVSCFVLLMLLRNWYPKAKLDRSKRSSLTFPLYLFSIFLPILIAISEPFGVFSLTLISLNIIIIGKNAS